MNVLKTVQFFCKAWRLDIKSEIIANYWKKSEVTRPIHGPLSRPIDYEDLKPAVEFESQSQSQPEKEIEQLFTHLVQTGVPKEDCLNISNFIDPPDKAVFNPQNDVLKHIATQFDAEKETKSNEELELRPKRTHKEVMNVLAVLHEHEKQADDESRN